MFSPPICPLIHLFIHTLIHPPIYPSNHLSIHPVIIRPFIHLSVCHRLSIYPTIHLPVYMTCTYVSTGRCSCWAAARPAKNCAFSGCELAVSNACDAAPSPGGCELGDVATALRGLRCFCMRQRYLSTSLPVSITPFSTPIHA